MITCRVCRRQYSEEKFRKLKKIGLSGGMPLTECECGARGNFRDDPPESPPKPDEDETVFNVSDLLSGNRS